MVTSFSQFKKWAICLMAGLCMALCTNAQIGYQISLLNTATGEPRANETVNVTATITDSSGGVIYTGTQSVTSNDFGVLSLSVGNADTFTNLDLQEHRLPFFIEVSANGAMIGKTQILSVPVAEVARQLEPLKLEDVVGTWNFQTDTSMTFNSNMTAIYHSTIDSEEHYNGNYMIEGKNIIFYYSRESNEGGYYHSNCFFIFRIINGELYKVYGL